MELPISSCSRARDNTEGRKGREEWRYSGPDAVAEMPLLRRQLRSEPEEVNVAGGVVAMGRSGVAARGVCAGRMPGRMPTLRCAQTSIAPDEFGLHEDGINACLCAIVRVVCVPGVGP
jgi:hypothetical protein